MLLLPNHPFPASPPVTPSAGENPACPHIMLLRQKKKKKLEPGKAFCLRVASGKERKIELEKELRGKNGSKAIREKVDVMNEKNGEQTGRKKGV